MDKIFLLQKELSEVMPIDGAVYANILQTYAPYSCDKVISEKEMNMGNLDASVIPVGSVEFSEGVLWKETGVSSVMPPVQIPQILYRYTPKGYCVMSGNVLLQNNDLPDCGKYFIKDISRLKFWNNLLQEGSCRKDILPDHVYSIAERTDFRSEYRVFVHSGEILAVQPYLGDPLAFPDPAAIRTMAGLISSDPSMPEAFTLDIGIEEESGKTLIIEIHNFISCGLYGFCDREIVSMLTDGWKWVLRHSKIDNNHTKKASEKGCF